ncbi:MAG TPA: sialate O-acetylesterase [Bacteroidales bacterium]|nr:sialate O-acetylesterase [Bacteroidales bacterium]
MKRFIGVLPVFITLLPVAGCTGNEVNTYKLYYLGGQSNMDGFGYVNELPEGMTVQFSDIYIFHGNTSPDNTLPDGKGLWANMRTGHGTGFTSDGITNNYSNRFGVEITFAARMKELDPGSGVALLKYSRSGTSIDQEAARGSGSWDPDYSEGNGINQYDHFLASVEIALGVEDIDGDGKRDKLIPSGILWMQGESDGDVSEEIALRYYENLTQLMGLIRKALGSEDIPIVIGRISDSGDNQSGVVWEWANIVREAQMKYAEADPNAGIVTTTDNYGYSDPWHYDSEGYIDLGKQFAIVLDSLNRQE